MTQISRIRAWKLALLLPYPLIAGAWIAATQGNLGGVWAILLGAPWSFLIASAAEWIAGTRDSDVVRLLILLSPFINAAIWSNHCLRNLRALDQAAHSAS